MAKGLDTPKHLWDWLHASGRKNLVLRVADVLGLEERYQQRLAAHLGHDDPVDRSWWQQKGVNGYITISWDYFKDLTMAQLQDLQEILMHYVLVRQEKGEPSRKEVCECNRGDRPDPTCKYCDGTGAILVLLEMTEEEQRLAEGR